VFGAHALPRGAPHLQPPIGVPHEPGERRREARPVHAEEAGDAAPDELRDAAHRDFPMAPPTWWTLQELAAHDTAAEAFAAARHRPQQPIQPIMVFQESGFSLKMPGHPDHPAPAMEGLPRTIRFQSGWVAEP